MVYLLDRDIEKMLMEPLSADDAATLREEVANEIAGPWSAAEKAVILTSTSVRKQVWQILEKEFPDLAVALYQELVRDINIQPIARISWPEAFESEQSASS